MSLSVPMSPCIILLSFCRGRFFCLCQENTGGIRATNIRGTGRLFPISDHIHQPAPPVSTSHRRAHTSRDECVFPTACSFSQASLLPVWSLTLAVKRSLIHSRWRFDFLVWAIDDCSSLWACFNVSLKVASLGEASPTIIVNISFCQFGDVFDQKCVPFVNSNSHDVF